MAVELSDRRKAKVEKIYKQLQDKYETGENMSEFLETLTEANASLNENQQKYLQSLIEGEEPEVPDFARKAKLKAELQHEAAKYRERDPSAQVSDSNIWDHLKEGARKKWSNQTGNQETEPLYFFKPTHLYEKKADDHDSLETIMKSAAATGNRVRAIGSGHSYSDCMITTDYLVDTHSLKKIAGHKKDIAGQLSQEVLKAGSLPYGDKVMEWNGYNPEANHALVELECGVTISDLNKKLDSRKLGLMNMGGYDGQTLMGVISTSTHGSGVGIGPFCDMVKSLVLVTLGPWDGKTVNTDGDVVYYYRIEPTNGITDPAKYNGGKIKLVQNDDLFNSAICNMGCFGIVYSIVLEVMQQYWLHEQRTMDTLDNVLKMLKPDPSKEGHFPALMTDFRNMEILVHPYPMVDDKEVMEFDPNNIESIYPHIKCLITKRNIVEKPNIFGRSGGRDFLSTFVSQFNGSFKAAVCFLNTFPLMIPNAITMSMKSLVSDYTNVSHEVYVLGLNGNAGFAAEIGYSIEDKDGNYTDKYVIASINRILTTAQRARVTGFQFQTSAYSLRFVKRSPAFMSMMNRRNTMMIEMDMITGCTGGYSVMKRFEREMYSLGGRPHWGLDFDWINGSLGLERLYKDFPKWTQFFNNFNVTGCFHSQFTNRLGLWEYDIDPEAQDPTGQRRIED